MMSERRSKSAPVGVVGKVILILETLNATPEGLLLREVVEATGLNKSTAYRFLAHLENESYVFRDASGYYMVGPRLAKLGSGTSYQATLCRKAAPVLSRLCKKTDETINLAVLDGDMVLYLSVFECEHVFRMASKVGTRRPLYCTALGKAILASLSKDHQAKLMKTIRFNQHTPRTITSAMGLSKELVKIAQRGYSIDEEEAVVGARCIAACIRDGEGKVIGGISLSGPTVRVTPGKIAGYAEALIAAADEIGLDDPGAARRESNHLPKAVAAK
jgi:DNA-binding IclR family transcriptional regulator